MAAGTELSKRERNIYERQREGELDLTMFPLSCKLRDNSLSARDRPNSRAGRCSVKVDLQQGLPRVTASLALTIN